VSLGPNETATYTVSGRVTAAGSVANTATITPTTPGCQPAPNAQCGGGPATTGPVAATANPVFTQTKTADATSYIVGQPITYTITVTNTGAGPGTATIADAVPGTVSVATVSCTGTAGGSCTTTGSVGNTVAGTVDLPAGASAIYTITGTVTSAGDATNIATITPTTPGCSTQCGGGDASTRPLPVGQDPVFTQKKVTDQSSYIVGQPITYTITVTNIGLAAGTATISDVVPSTVASLAVTCSATGTGTCNTTGSSGNTIAGAVSLGPSEVATYTVTGAVSSAGSVANTATISPTTPGCTTQCGGGDASTAPTTASPNPVFTQTKTADASFYTVGQPITYTITVTNTGGGPGTATIADPVPPTVGSVNVTCAATGTGTCNTTGSSGNTVGGSVSLPAGEVATYTVKGTVIGISDVSNTATVTPTTPGCTTQCGGGSASTGPLNVLAPNFTQTKKADQTSYIVGQLITYTITVTNAGAGPGMATISDTVPATVGPITVACTATTGGTCDTTGSTGSTVAGTVSLPAGSSATYTVKGTLIGIGDASNAVAVMPTTPGCTTQCGGGSASTGPLSVVGPNFTQAKTVSSGPYIAGNPITYTITVSNNGQVAGDATVRDTVPAAVGSVSVTCTVTGGGTCVTTGSSGNNVAGSITGLAPGGTSVYTVMGTVVGAGGASLTNTATITPTSPSCCGGGNASTPAISVTPTANQQLTKTLDAPGPFTIGESVPFSVVMSNSGPDAATNVMVADIPTGLTQVSASPQVGSYNPATGIWTIPTLNAGQTVTLRLVQRITLTTAVNKAAIVDPGAFDPGLANNTGVNCTPPGRGCVAVSLVASPAVVPSTTPPSPSSPSAPTAPQAAAPGPLAVTGLPLGIMVALGLALLAAGFLLRARARRNRSPTVGG
jgi:uncharacterized repeat protein (TIGR01451 family)